jgi:hypothetical protein
VWCIRNANFQLSETTQTKGLRVFLAKHGNPGACLGPECNPSFDTSGSKLSFSCRTSINSLQKTDLFSSSALVMVPQTIGEYFDPPLSLGLGQGAEKYSIVFSSKQLAAVTRT